MSQGCPSSCGLVHRRAPGTRVDAFESHAPIGPCCSLDRPPQVESCPAPRRDIRDPRFETLAGRLEEGRFRKQYAFLYEEALPQERSGMKAALKVRHAITHTLSPTSSICLLHLCTAFVLQILAP